MTKDNIPNTNPRPETTQVPPETTQVPPETTQVPPETTQVPPETTQVPPETTQVPPVTGGADIPPAPPVTGLLNSDSIQALNEVALRLQKRVGAVIYWYLTRKRWPQRFSRIVRGVSIFLLTVGGLAPLVGDVTTGGYTADRIGYICIALAASTYFLDKFFGFSNTWMRYMAAQMALQRTLENFQLNWSIWFIQAKTIRDDDADPSHLAAAINLLIAFQNDAANLVDQEFRTWIIEFKEQIQTLQDSVQKGSSERAPGKLLIAIRSDQDISGQKEILLDKRPVEKTQGSSAQVVNVTPGTYVLSVRAVTTDGKPVEGTVPVTVRPDQITSAEVVLT